MIEFFIDLIGKIEEMFLVLVRNVIFQIFLVLDSVFLVQVDQVVVYVFIRFIYYCYLLVYFENCVNFWKLIKCFFFVNFVGNKEVYKLLVYRIVWCDIIFC